MALINESTLFPVSAGVTLDFLIIGGSIAGLTSAYCLQDAGHNVTVVEKNGKDSFMSQRYSGLRVPPNMTHLLNRVPGVKHLLAQKSSSNPGYLLYQEESFELVGKMIYEESITSDLGQFSFRLGYSDLWNHLYELCISRNINCKFDFEVDKVVLDADGGKPTVYSTTGEAVFGDILVGADGHNSTIREFLLSENSGDDCNDEDSWHPNSTEPEIWTTRRLSIPVNSMKHDPDLRILIQNDWTTLLMGDGLFAMGGQEGIGQYGVTISYLQAPADAHECPWNSLRNDLSSEERKLVKSDTILGKLVGLPESSHNTIQKAYNLSAYVNGTHQVVLIGGAAPAALENGAYNAAIAVEDAFTLGYLFSKITSRNHVALFLNGYNEIRKSRAHFMRENDMGVLHGLSLPPGPQREARNRAYSHTLGEDDLDDETLSQVWAAHIDQCNYDAIEAVDEWWHSWGSLIEKYHG
ncbi:FAD/NAD(P)-binding domain-containing protein [Dendrothele bispora CBS 962.96]|uniref:FAD/NAD(P)-binding domain-containing protein n=1 Tax=Dendrothele bispora (strain CBS 962.96) TaxID=1314807 RepID=A0A4S8LJU8_DENBC|nr:FAD/NAD(P)-binding domain-containing protein [Dendrothele bispora CBS 962.96]